MVAWLRKRFGPLWTVHVLTNVLLAWALLIWVVWTLPWWVGIVTALCVGGSTTNTILLFLVRRDAERLDILDAIDTEPGDK